MLPLPLPAALTPPAFQTLFDALPVGVMLHDHTRRVVWANAAAARLLLVSQEQLLGLDAAATEWQAMDSAGRPLTADQLPMSVALTSGAPVHGAVVGIYVASQSARWLQVDAVPLTLPDGERYVLLTFAELQSPTPAPPLQELRVTGSAARPDAFLQVDEQWRFTHADVGGERLLGRPRDQLLGHELWRLRPDLDGGAFHEHLVEAMADRLPRRFEAPFPDPSRWVEVDLIPSPKGLSLLMSDSTERRAAQRTRQQLAQRMEVLLNSVEAGIYGLDREGRLTFINPAGAAMLGYSAEALLGQEMHALTHHHYPDGRPFPFEECPMHRAVQSGQVMRCEDEVLWRADGTPMPVQYVAAPIVEGEHIVGTVVSFHDITERRRRAQWQEFLSEAGARLSASLDYRQIMRQLRRDLLPAVSDWATLTLMGEEEKVTVALSTAPTATLAQRAVIERLTRDYLAQGRDAAIEYVLTRGETVVIPEITDRALGALAEEPQHLELLRELGLGSLLVLPMWVRGRRVGALALRRFAGAAGYTPLDVEFATTLAERIAVTIENARLFGDALRFRETLDATTDAVYFVDHEGLHLTYANQGLAEQVGYPNEALVGMPMLSLLPDFDEERLQTLLDPLHHHTESARRLETLHRRRDGSLVPIEVTLQYVEPHGERGSYVVIARDITQRRESERLMRERTAQLGRMSRALLRSNAELDQFAYIASHDLKAPLRGISNLAQWIEEDLEQHLTAETRHQMKLLQSRVRRMERLIDGLLQYSRVGRSRSHVTTLRLSALIRSVVDLLAPPPGFTVEIERPLPTIRGEQAPLELVFRNLIGNAIKHHDRSEGRVEISARVVGEWVEFTVKDDGPGIPEVYHDKIFVIFQRLKSSDEVEGTGLGLSLVKKQVEEQGGSIRVEAAGERGVAFIFTWPLTPPERETSHVPA